MYGLAGGCSSILHLAILHPILVGALGLAGFASQVSSNPGVGDRLGTQRVLTATQNKIVRDNPSLATKTVALRADFDRLESTPTEDQVKSVLAITDACTDLSVQDVMKDPGLKKELAWIMFLDVYARDGPKKARELYKPPRK